MWFWSKFDVESSLVIRLQGLSFGLVFLLVFFYHRIYYIVYFRKWTSITWRLFFIMSSAVMYVEDCMLENLLFVSLSRVATGYVWSLSFISSQNLIGIPFKTTLFWWVPLESNRYFFLELVFWRCLKSLATLQIAEDVKNLTYEINSIYKYRLISFRLLKYFHCELLLDHCELRTQTKFNIRYYCQNEWYMVCYRTVCFGWMG